MVTPWQARLVLICFLVVGAGITANLLLQERRAATATLKAQPPRAAPDVPVRARTQVAPGPEAAKLQPAAAAPRTRPAGAGKASSRRPIARAKSVRTVRQPATTASTR